MSSGSSLALMAVSAQDSLLTADGDNSGAAVTFFRQTLELSTRFQSEHVSFTPSGSISWGRKVSFNITRIGDMLAHSYVRIVLPALYNDATGAPVPSVTVGTDVFATYTWVPLVGYAVVQEAALIVGGSTISKITKDVNVIIHELFTAAGRVGGLDQLVGYGDAASPLSNSMEHTLYVPLNGLFFSEYATSLPLVALQFHPVTIELTLGRFEDVVTLSPGAPAATDFGSPAAPENKDLVDLTLLCEMILLANKERTVIAQSPHTISITQWQTETDSVGQASVYKAKLGMNHPVSALFYFLSLDADRDTLSKITGSNKVAEDHFRDPFKWGGNRFQNNPIINSSLQLNSHTRFDHDGVFTGLLTAYERASNVPDVSRGLNMYSFALNPADDSICSGSVSFSRMDNVQLNLRINPDYYTPYGGAADKSNATLTVVAKSWNAISILSGMLGLQFAA